MEKTKNGRTEMKIRYFGHSAFMLTNGAGLRVLIDPFLDDNPLSPVKSDEIDAEYIIATHAHADHLGDSLKIAKRCDATIIGVAELAWHVESKGCKAHAMQIGGAYSFPFGRVKLTPALHGSQTPEGQYAGLAAGVLLWVDGMCIYHAGDTGLFYDMKLIGEMNEVDCFIVPIGDNFTMGIEDALKAVEFVNPKKVLPMHYNTWPVIGADPEEFARKVNAMGRVCLTLKPGDELQI